MCPTKSKTIRRSHTCFQSRQIDEQSKHIADIRTLLVGNHEPENGIVWKMLKVTDDVEVIKGDIAEIKTTIKEAIESSTKTAKALDLYKAEMGGIETGVKDSEEKDRLARDLKMARRRDMRFMIFSIISAVLTLIGLSAAIYFGFRNSKASEEIKSETRVTNDILSPPGSTRGKTYNPFANDTLNNK